MLHSSSRLALLQKTGLKQGGFRVSSSQARFFSSGFKRFFKLTVQDRPISPLRKAYEIYKTNPTIRRITMILKWTFALSFLLYYKQGVSLPGQYYFRLAEIELRFNFTTRAGQEEHGIKSIVSFLHWKLQFCQSHDMLSVEMITNDLDYLVEQLNALEFEQEH